MTLHRLQSDGWVVAGLTWQPRIAAGDLTEDQLAAIIARTNQLLGIEVEVVHCPHGAGPPLCWCRKPLPGMGAVLIRRSPRTAARGSPQTA